MHVLDRGIGPHVARRPPVLLLQNDGIHLDRGMPIAHQPLCKPEALVAVGDNLPPVSVLVDHDLAGSSGIPLFDALQTVRDTGPVATGFELEGVGV